MTETNVSTPKALVVTGFNKEIYSLFPDITNQKTEELMVVPSVGAVISHPYGCLMRTILLAIYNDDIKDIYIVGENGSKENEIDREQLKGSLTQAGVTEDLLDMLTYTRVVREDVTNWLVGPSAAEETVKENVECIQKHPLIPSFVNVRGFVADPETKEFKVVS